MSRVGEKRKREEAKDENKALQEWYDDKESEIGFTKRVISMLLEDVKKAEAALARAEKAYQKLVSETEAEEKELAEIKCKLDAML